VSGFQRNGAFDLTATKARQWHGSKRRCCRSLSDIARTHLVPAGFTWRFGTGGNFIVVNGPGLAQEDAQLLHDAISGV
jgi:hypothetical protein